VGAPGIRRATLALMILEVAGYLVGLAWHPDRRAPGPAGTRTGGHPDRRAPGPAGTRTGGHPDRRAPGPAGVPDRHR
jgi:hypothetical protein